jgi:hypothetical protein
MGRAALAAACLSMGAGPARALVFEFTAPSGTPQQVIDGFNLAGARWSANVNDNITVCITISYFNLHSGSLAETTAPQLTNSYSTIVDNLTARATSADDLSSVAHLQTGAAVNLLLNRTTNSPFGSGSATPYLDNNGNDNNMKIKATRANLKVLGTSFPGSQSDATIKVSNNFNWDYNPKDGISAGAYDFVGVATHEIGHALGFNSGVDTLDSTKNTPVSDDMLTFVTTMDLFRFSTQSLAQGNGVIDWTADTRDKYFSVDGGTTKIASMSTGVNFGDGSQASHWKHGLGLGIMDPIFSPGEQRNLSDNDRRIFDVLGYTRNMQWNWTEPAGGKWTDALNWNADGIPTPQIDAAFDTGGGTYTVTLNASAQAASLHVASDSVTFTLNGQTLTVAGTTTIDAAGAITVNTGTLNTGSVVNSGFFQSSGTLTVAGAFTNTGTAIIGGTQNWLPGSMLNVNGGSVTLNSDAGTSNSSNLSVSVGSGAALYLNATQHLKSLNIAGGNVTLAAGGATLLHTQALSIDPAGKLDLTSNQMVVRSDAANRLNVLNQVTGLIGTARGTGGWVGNGITSSIAAADPNRLTGLAVILNDKGNGTPIYTSFMGQSVDVNSILVKYTWNGDVDLNGKVDADDYFLVDSGFAKGLTGYRNGDLDYNGRIDSDDYFLIDRAFVGQAGTLSLHALAADALPASIPEPTTLGATLVGLLLMRRNRSRLNAGPCRYRSALLEPEAA